MNTIDFSNYKFRASGVKNLMVSSRSKTDPLSETTKSYLQEIWIKEVLGREKVVSTPAMQKGTIVESDSMDLVQLVHGKKYFKNNKQLENDFIKGTPDIIDRSADAIRDIKSSWDLFTFAKVDQNSARKDYFYQVLSYMWLAGTKNGSLIFALVNTPEHIIFSEFQKLSYSMNEDIAESLTRKNHTFDDIPATTRLREFHFEYCQADIDEVVQKITLAREYLQGFKL